MADFFELLGLPRRFDLADADIEANHLARSRAAHPDHHQLASSSEQRAGLELSAKLNEAYSILRDPFRRADHILTLIGGPTAAQLRDMSPDFLEAMLELRMEIEELRESGDERAKDAMEARLKERRSKLIDDIAACFARGDGPETLVAVRRLLNTAKYIQGLLRDLHE